MSIRITDFFSSMIYLFVLQEVLQFGVGLYALQLVSDNLPDFGTDTVVVILDHLLHEVVAAGICKVRDDGYRPVSLYVYTAFSFGMTYFAPFRIDLRIKILPTLP